MNRFNIVDTYYWWLADHHEGQGSRKYKRLSKITRYFKPGLLSKGPEDAEGYRTLCERAGCTHLEDGATTP